jgi:dCMP deaminase
VAADRPSVDQYFMDMTHLVKARGTCPRRRVGAVIVKDKRVLTTGYNGAPRNFPHPVDVGCLRDELQIPKGMMADICPCLHAEQNAILQAATTGVSIEGGDLFCTTQPCTQCSRMLANCGIRRVVFEEEYPDPLATGILTTAGVELWRWDAANKTAHKLKGNTFEQAQDALREKWKSGAFTPQPPPGVAIGALPMHGQPPRPAAPRSEAQPEAPDAGASGAVRDLRDDPKRAELIRRLAKEKVERKRQQQDEGR